ncbi:MAG: Holliday junction resolvase RuvX [Opitutales bacterium]
MNTLGIDYGEKRVGLAFGDELAVATPLPAATEAKKLERIAHIQKVITERRIREIVIGYPYNMDGSVGFKAKEVDAFVEALKKAGIELPIHRVDERLTSHQVETQLRSMNQKWDRKSGEVDSRAATLILQDFLDQRYPALGGLGDGCGALDMEDLD